MNAKLSVPVFDSSSVDIPNPTPIKFSSFEGQPLIAWRPSNRSRQRDAPTADTPERSVLKTPSLQNGTPSPRENSSEIVLEGRSTPQSKHRVSINGSRKFVEPIPDKRSKTILDILKSKREQKRSDLSSRGNEEFISKVGEEVNNDKVVTYPKFIVREKKDSKQESKDKHPNSHEGSNKLHKSQSVRMENVRDYENKQSDLSNKVAQRDKGSDVRRSFRKLKTSGAYLYESSAKPFPQHNPNYTGRSGYEQELDDFIMGFFPEEMQEYIQAKSMNVAPGRPGGSPSQKARTQSPPYEHIPPPPTPASQLLMQLGFDHSTDHDKVEEEMRKEDYFQMQRRKSLWERGRSREKSSGKPKRDQSDPGVSNTTHQLLEQNIIRRHFIFPDLSAEACRKSLNIPRYEDKTHMYRMTPNSMHSSKTHVNGTTHFASVQFAVEPVQMYDLSQPEDVPPQQQNTEPMQVAPIERSPSKIDFSASHDQLHVLDSQRSHSSLGVAGHMTRSHSFYQGQKKDRYLRMISLGLPKVNLDIDKNHFSPGNILRRSFDLREKYQIPDNVKEVKVGEQNGQKYLKTNAPQNNTEADKNSADITAESKESDVNQEKPAKEEVNHTREYSAFHVNLNENLDFIIPPTPEVGSHRKFRPPPNTPIDGESSVFQRRTARGSSASKIPLKAKQSKIPAATKSPVNASQFKIPPPGKEKPSRDEVLSVSGRKAEYDKQPRKYKSPIEIIL